MILRILTGSMIALGLGLATESARAAETYMCDDGRLLKVELSDLERMTREDPCVAAHYGLTVQVVPLPVKRPGYAIVRGLKGAQASAKADGEIGAVARAPADSGQVRIINAPPGGRTWFRQRR